ncbi:MAG: DUF3899 domain-containing protein [Clostridia bacterium]|nr:DUF3899 domain-containing protein [Clostridia bacterium]
MKNENKALLIKYAVCFGVASVITLLVFWSKGFFTDNLGVNIQILSDGFFVSGILLTLFAGMLFVSGEGALIGISFVLRNVVLAFTPMGRKHHEVYAKYRERKLASMKKSGDHCILFTGLFFLLIGIVFTVIWYTNFYNIV